MTSLDPASADRAVLEELRNIVHNYPLFPGNTISHATANECVRRGWAERNLEGDFLPTADGMRRHEEDPYVG